MARLCERPGCSNPAEVSYGFDAEHLVVWLDAFGGPLGARSGVLCLRHANAMVVPLGWMLDDRREAVPRLFKSPVVEEAPKRRRAIRAGRHHQDDTEQLFLDAAMVAAIPDDDIAAVVAEHLELEEEPDTSVSPVEPGDAVSVDDAPVDDAPVDDAPVDDAPVDDAPVDDAAGGPVAVDGVPGWQPLFDHRDDLHGLLTTRGSLLSRAFHGTPRNT